MIDPRDEMPDRSASYRKADPDIMLHQLNENWRQLRLVRRAVADRDDIIGQLHEAIRKRDKMIAAQAESIKLYNRLRPLLYAVTGGVVVEIVKTVLRRLLR